MTSKGGIPSLAARTVASGGALGSAAAIASFHWFGLSITLGISALVVASSALLVHVRRLSAQIVTRGLLAASALLGGLDVALGPRAEAPLGWVVLGGSVLALLVTGSRGLRESPRVETVFHPRAHRSALVAVLGLAVAMAASLGFFGVAHLEAARMLSLTLPLAIGFGLSAIGLYRMRAWGVLGVAASALVTALLSMTGPLSLPVGRELQIVFGFTAAVQLVLLAPLLLGAARRLREPNAPVDRLRVAPAPLSRTAAASSNAFEAEAETLAAEEDRSLSPRRFRL